MSADINKINQAKAYYQQAIALNPQDAEAYNNLGDVFRLEGNLEEAIACYRQAILINSNYAEAHNNLANVLAVKGNLEEAIASYQQVLTLNPNYAVAHNNLGNCLLAKGNLEEAIASYQQAINLNFYYAEAYYNLGNALKTQGNLAEAEIQYQLAVTLKPFPEAHNNLGLVLQEQGKIEEAIASYQQALALNPKYTEAHNNLGNAFEEKGNLEEAIACYQQALSLNPNYIEALNNLGNTFLTLGKTEEAIACYQQALIINPNYVPYYNLGNALKYQGKLTEAIAYLQQTLALDPDFAEAHQNLGIILLLTGDFKNGFAEYEWRWKTKEYRKRHFIEPFWNSSDLQGKKIFLLCEQGFGDNIQFIRYAAIIAQKGAHVIVGCYQELQRLFSTVAGIEQIVTTGTVVDYDYCAPLMSLPHLLGTSLETIPAHIPYIFPPQSYPFTLSAPPETRLKVGIVWAGNPGNINDRNRSCNLTDFLSLLHIPQIAFYSLQKGQNAKDLAKLNLLEKVQDLSEKLSDFADTAAVIAQLDLVITVDTSVAHLAGAMGKPVWVLLSYVGDWRWMLEREDSPWYPTLRLFRQSKLGDWTEVFQKVAVELSNLVASPETTSRTGLIARPTKKKLHKGIKKEKKTKDSSPITQSISQIAELLDLALEHHNAGRLIQAKQIYRQILLQQPTHASAHKNLGTALMAQGKLAEAISHYQQAIAINPNDAQTHYNLGIAFYKQRRIKEVIACFQQAITLNPYFAEAHYNLSLTLLLIGDFKNGFAEYEWRWQTQEFTQLSYPFPLWNGSNLQGQKILLACEQGFGDAIQFIRYASLVAKLGGHVIVSCHESLQRLFSAVAGIEKVVTKEETVECDVHAPLMSLPHLLGTTLETVPASVPYLEAPQPYPFTLETPPGTHLKVGIVWAGNPENKNDRNRSCEIRHFLPVLSLPNIAFYSLQIGSRVADLTLLKFSEKVQDLSEKLHDFADTAAVIDQLDLVITVDTSVAHLAGAMGKPAWVLLSYVADWRWMLEREDSPWYPTLRLFCQSKLRDWTEVFQKVAVELSNLVAQTQEKLPTKMGHNKKSQSTSQITELLAIALEHHYGGRLLEADKIYRQILLQQPTNFDAHNNLGTVMMAQGKLAEAQFHYQKAIASNPKEANGHYNLGTAFDQQGKIKEAIACYEKALSLNPNHAYAHNNLGIIFYQQGKIEEAIAYYQKALALNPNYAYAHNNLGNAFLDKRNLEKAIASYQKAIALDTNFASAHKNLGIALLLTGELKNGFAKYEWRWQTQEYAESHLPKPLWDGSNLQGKRILLICEQGFGDNIQFIRYASILSQQKAHVIVRCDEPLLRLFSTVVGIKQAVLNGTVVEFDCCASLMSLPHLLGTTLETIPANIPYLSPPQPYPFTLETPPGTRLKVGIVWAGNPENKNDRNRSCEFRHFLPIFNIPGIAFYSLQIGSKIAELTELNISEKVQDLSEKLHDFADTSAVIAQLDLVITVDTAVGHLAGALGKPVWVLLSFVADWRWMQQRENSPWYPTMRLFRQSQYGDWSEVFQRVAVELENWVVQLPKNLSEATVADKPTQEKLPETNLNLFPSDSFTRLKKCRHGILLYNINDTNIGRTIDIYGEYREAEIELFQQIIEPNDLIVEVGANIGTHTVLFARIVGCQGIVLAFEPQRLIFQNLSANLALNNITNTYCYNVALGDTFGSIKVPILDPSKPDNFGSAALGSHLEGELVQMITLDSLSVPYCRLIKVDVNGMELEVLRGAADTISRSLPIIYVNNCSLEKSRDLLEYLNSLGYKMYWHKTPLYNSNNYFRNSENVFGKAVSNNIFCLHSSYNLSIGGLEPVEFNK